MVPSDVSLFIFISTLDDLPYISISDYNILEVHRTFHG